MQDVYIADLDPATGKLLGQPRPAAGHYVGSNMRPSWSPDGQYLAYHSQRGPNPRAPGGLKIVVHSIATGQEREISTRLIHCGPLHWFPDGQSLLVSAYRDKSLAEVDYYRIDVRTGEASLVRRSKSGYASRQPDLSPDGKAIFFTQTEGENSGRTKFIVYQIETGQETEIYQVVGEQRVVWSIAVSPNGRELAFVEPDETAGTTAVKVIPAGGGHPRELLKAQLPERIQRGFGIEWMPDGRHLLVGKSREPLGVPVNEVWHIPIEGGEAHKVGLAKRALWRLSVHPDGKRITFDSMEPKTEVWVMENFLPAVKAGR
jgi:Tol biopolymer transport system component